MPVALPSCPFWGEGSVGAPRGTARACPETPDIEFKFRADACDGVAVQAQSRRRLADIALGFSKRGRDKGLLELVHGFSVEDAVLVHLCHQQIQTLLHGAPR